MIEISYTVRAHIVYVFTVIKGHKTIPSMPPPPPTRPPPPPPRKAVVAGPAGRREPDHFFGRVCFPPCPFFLVLAHFSLCLPLIFNLLMQWSKTLERVSSIDRHSQGVKTLKNNAISIMTVIILMGRVERKTDVIAFEDQRRRPAYTSAQSDQCLCCSPS